VRYAPIFGLIPAVSLASAWVKEENALFISTTFNHYRAQDYYDKRGDRRPIGCTFEKEELQVYGEYGLGRRTTLTFKLPYDWLSCGGDRTSGFVDFEVGFIRQMRKDKNYSLSLYGNAIVPTGYSITDSPRLGYGRPALEGGLLYGVSGRLGFLDSGLGYRHYFGYPSSQIRTYATDGINIFKNIQFLTTLDLQMGLGDGKRKQVGQNVLLEPDYKLAQTYVRLRLMFKNLSFVATYQYVLWGKNTGVGRGVDFSVWWSF